MLKGIFEATKLIIGEIIDPNGYYPKYEKRKKAEEAQRLREKEKEKQRARLAAKKKYNKSFENLNQDVKNNSNNHEKLWLSKTERERKQQQRQAKKETALNKIDNRYFAFIDFNDLIGRIKFIKRRIGFTNVNFNNNNLNYLMQNRYQILKNLNNDAKLIACAELFILEAQQLRTFNANEIAYSINKRKRKLIHQANKYI